MKGFGSQHAKLGCFKGCVLEPHSSTEPILAVFIEPFAFCAAYNFLWATILYLLFIELQNA